MVWVIFILSSAVIVYAAIKLAAYGDAISIRTGLGGMFIGLILMASATSLPEFLTTIQSIRQNVPDLAAGNMFGSNMFNMLLLALIDFMAYRTRVLRKVARRHALSGSIAILMAALAVFFVLANLPFKIGWVGVDSLVIILAYLGGLWIIQRESGSSAKVDLEDEAKEKDGLPGMFEAVLGFSLATAALVLVMPSLVSSSKEIAEITGLGTGFIGTALVGVITSLPELVATAAAIRQKVYDMAIGNLFGSNMFNMFALALADFFFLDGRFIGVIDPNFVLVGIIGLLMTVMGLIGNLARLERRLLFIEADAFFIIVTYFLGMWLIYTRSIGI